MKHSRDANIRSSVKKLQLLAYNPHKRPSHLQKELYVSVDNKFGRISFGKNVVNNLGMKNSFVIIYYDVYNKVIAWRLMKTCTPELLRIGWKIVKTNRTGTYISSIKSILQQMKLNKPKYNKLEVKKYRDVSLIGGDDYYYIEVK